MPQVTKNVNKTEVTNSEIFIYTYNISFSGLTEPATNAMLKDFFPSKIKYELPPTGSLIKNIIETPVVGGTEVQFDFGHVAPGTSIQFTLASEFGVGRVQNDSFTNVADLYIDGVKNVTGTAPTVNLTLTGVFRLRKQISPDRVEAGTTVNVYLYLENTTP